MEREQDRKLELIQKFYNVYKFNGFKSISLDDLCREFSISKKTIYQYFRNKDEVIENVVGYFIDNIAAQFIVEDNSNPFEELIVLFHRIIENPENITPAFFQSLYGKNKEFNITINDFFFNLLKQLISGSVEHDYIKKDIDTNAFIIAQLNLIYALYDLKYDRSLVPKLSPGAFLNNAMYSIRGIATQKGLDYLDHNCDHLSVEPVLEK